MTTVVNLAFTAIPDERGLGRMLPKETDELRLITVDPLKGPATAGDLAPVQSRLSIRAKHLANVVELGIAAGTHSDDPIVVLASCTGARIAVELGRELTRRERRLSRLVVVDPKAVQDGDLWVAFELLLRRMNVSEQERSVIFKEFAVPIDSPDETLRQMRRHLERVADVALTELPQSNRDTFVKQLVDRYFAWLNFLVESASAEVGEIDCEVHIVEAMSSVKAPRASTGWLTAGGSFTVYRHTSDPQTACEGHGHDLTRLIAGLDQSKQHDGGVAHDRATGF